MLAKHMNLRPASITEIIQGTREVSITEAMALADFLQLPEQDIFARIAGRNPDDASEPTEVPTLETGADADLKGGWSVSVVEIDVSASAGPGLEVTDEKRIGEWHLPRTLIQGATGTPADHLRIISVKGRSMEPMFFPHDKVMVDTLDRKPTPPGPFVVWDGLGEVVKMVQFVPHSDPQKVKIVSVNAEYGVDPYERTLDEAHIQGRVLGKWWWA